MFRMMFECFTFSASFVYFIAQPLSFLDCTVSATFFSGNKDFREAFFIQGFLYCLYMTEGGYCARGCNFHE